MKILKFTIGISLLIGMLFSPRSFAEDVYNFYFQKAPGPTTVIQGGSTDKSQTVKSVTPEELAKQSEQPPKEQASESISANVPAQEVPPPNKDYRNWEIFLGMSYVADQQATWRGQGVGFQYNFNRLIGLQTTLLKASGNDFSSGLNYAQGNNNDYLDGSVGLIMTPLRLNLFGYDILDISAMSGVLTTRKYPVDDYGFSAPDQEREFKFFYGLQAALNISRAVALTTQIKVVSDRSQFGQGLAGLTVRF